VRHLTILAAALGAMALLSVSQQSAWAQSAPAAREIAYGADPLQRLDFHTARARKPAPLLVFVHGGGWRQGDKRNAGAEKVAHFLDRGFAFASVNYRLVPAAKVEDQAQDVANAVAYLVEQARELDVDASRIVLAGHSAGAHLSALVATDPHYLSRAGLGSISSTA
jgi:acetyl esterase/lipase